MGKGKQKRKRHTLCRALSTAEIETLEEIANHHRQADFRRHAMGGAGVKRWAQRTRHLWRAAGMNTTVVQLGTCLARAQLDGDAIWARGRCATQADDTPAGYGRADRARGFADVGQDCPTAPRAAP
jgi:hypothetical protein